MGQFKNLSGNTNYFREQEINEQQKPTQCKYCKKEVLFQAIAVDKDQTGKEIIRWGCFSNYGSFGSHSSVCLGSAKPKFAEGDIIISKWKEHSTMYIVSYIIDGEVYNLRYYKKPYQDVNIPVKVIDKNSSKCDKGMADAIFS